MRQVTDKDGLVEVETEIEVTAINDSTLDYFVRLSQLVPEYNVGQLKKMERSVGGRRIVPLGIRTDTISLPRFRERVEKLRLTVELRWLDA